MDWRVKVWGVRGAAPRPETGYLQYGGNTSCVSLERDGEIAVLDAGSGLPGLARELSGREVGRLDIFISHLHLDHVMGLFCFPPLHDPNMEIHLYCGAGLRESLETLVGPPYWPLGLRNCRAHLCYHELEPGDHFQMGGFSGYTMAGNHPGGSLLCRLEAEGKSLVYALDCETDENVFGRLSAFSRGADLLIWDASYTQADKWHGWGHSTWEEGLALCRDAGAKRVLMTHYAREYTDQFLREQERKAQTDSCACVFAREGMVLDL